MRSTSGDSLGRCVLLVIVVFGILWADNASADGYGMQDVASQAAKATQICSDVQSQINEMPHSTSIYTWPKLLHLNGLTWPIWQSINTTENPKNIETVVKKVSLWGSSREFYPSYSYYLDRTGGEIALTNGWTKFELPILRTALKDHQFELQRSVVPFVNDTDNSTYLLRFRIAPDRDISFQSAQKDPGPGELYTDGNWAYLVDKTNINKALNDVPISPFNENIHGELATIGPLTVIFETGSADFSFMDVVYLSDVGDEFHAIYVSRSCSLVMPGLSTHRRVDTKSK